MKRFHHSLLAAAITTILLSGCGGGGGGNVRPTAPPPPPPPPPPSVCEDPAAENNGAELPCVYRYNGTADNHLVPTNVDRAHEAGFDGSGVKIGLLDGQRTAADYATLDGQVAFYKDYYTTAGPDDPAQTSNLGHGSFMAALIVGLPVGGYAGGVAPGASLYWARICYNNLCQPYPAYDELISQGVRLFNHSLGSLAEKGKEAEIAASHLHYAQSLIDADALIVASTGNDGADRPSGFVATPFYEPTAMGHWLGVANVTIDAQGQPGGLDPTSNACGLAAQWCLVAPGTSQAPPVGAFNSGIGIGTSNSAAITTGVAALVWQAFPWMGARNVQQTLLTTATDIGPTGVDPEFGWGMINATAAVKGPGQFTDIFTADVDSGAWSFDNPITGAGGLVKRGGGTLKLTADNTYTGITEIQAGVLGLSGAIGGDVNVANGATLATTNGHIVGDYTAVAGATTAVHVGAPLTIGGTAWLDGTLSLLAPASGYTVTSEEVVLQAGTVDGTFNDLTYGSGLFYTATLDYTDTTVTANMTRAEVQAMVMVATSNPVAVEVGARVGGLLGQTDDWVISGQTGQHQEVITAAAELMSAPTREAGLLSLESLAGEVQGTARALAFQQAGNDALLLAQRADALGRIDRSGVWVQAQGASGTLQQGAFADAHYHQGGIMLGADRVTGGGTQLGIALSASQARARLDGVAGDLDSDRTGISVYGRTLLGAGYLTGVLGYDYFDTDTHRTVVLNGVPNPVTASRNDGLWHVRGEWGIDLDSGLTPFVAGGAMHHDQGGFVETGAGGLGLAAESDGHTVTYAEAGLRLRHGMEWFGQRANLSSYVSVRRVLSGEDSTFKASFAATSQSTFEVVGQGLARNSHRAGFSLTSAVGKTWSWNIDLGFERANGHKRGAFGAVGTRVKF